MTAPVRVGLLFGGRSVEHEVSVTSAREVADAMRGAGIAYVPIAVTGDGSWLAPAASEACLKGDAPRVDSEPIDDPCSVLIDSGRGCLVSLGTDGTSESFRVDVVFPLIHGWGGEDGRLQGALELARIPYVGSGVLGSALAMDKALAKTILERHGLPGVPWISATRDAYSADPAALQDSIRRQIGFPVFVKPANGGSSVGISRVNEASALSAALDEAFACDLKVVVEAGVVDAREIECAVLGNAEPEVAEVVGEIVPHGEFYDYDAKYVDDRSQLHIPAPIDAETRSAVRDYAGRAYRALDLRGLARIDFLIDRGTGRIYLNEANTLPGFTPISMFPKLWEASGLPYSRLIERLIELALDYRDAESGLRTAREED